MRISSVIFDSLSCWSGIYPAIGGPAYERVLSGPQHLGLPPESCPPEGGAVVVRDFAPDHWVLIVRQVIKDFRPYILMHGKVASLVDVAVLENYFCLVVTWTLAFRLFLPPRRLFPRTQASMPSSPSRKYAISDARCRTRSGFIIMLIAEIFDLAASP